MTVLETETALYKDGATLVPIVNRAWLMKICTELHLENEYVKEIRLGGQEVIVTFYHHEEEGKARIVSPDGQGVLTYEARYAVVG